MGEMVQPWQSFLFGKINVQNLGRSDDGKQRKKKRPNAIRKQYKCLYVDNTTFSSLSPDISFYLDKIHRWCPGNSI